MIPNPTPLRVRLVGGMKKWDDRKLGEDKKVRGQKKCCFLSYIFGWEDEKVERCKTMKNEVDINLQLYPY